MSNISVSGVADFTIASNNCGASVPAGGSCTVGVKFAPTTYGARTGSLSVATALGTTPVTLSAVGLQGYPSFSPSPASFPTTAVGQTSPLAITLCNIGNSNVTVSSITISNNAAEFAMTNMGCRTIGKGLYCPFYLSFTPTGTGPRTGVATVNTSAGAFTLNLTGTATP